VLNHADGRIGVAQSVFGDDSPLAVVQRVTTTVTCSGASVAAMNRIRTMPRMMMSLSRSRCDALSTSLTSVPFLLPRSSTT